MRHSYPKRLLICLTGLALFGFGCFLGIRADSAGTNGWNTLSIGVSNLTGISFGAANFSVGLLIILVDLLGKGKIGIGTFLNISFVSWCTDQFVNVLSFIPVAPNPYIGALYTLIGQTILCFSTILYMTAGFGCGPRDTLMIIIGQKLPKVPIGVLKFGTEGLALVIGVLLGAPFGIGTILVMALQASIFQFACRVTHYDPRNIQHEDLVETFRNLTHRT